LLAQHPEYLRSPKAIFAAAKRDRADVVEFLLDLGVSIEIEDAQRQRPLHIAAGNDALRVAALLIERGAEIDPVELNWNNTPIDWAVYCEYPRMIELLGRYTRDVGNLAFIGNVARLRELLAAEPRLAKLNWGSTPLFWLPEDEEKAVEIVELFLANGADAGFRQKDGRTAADVARRRGLDDAAAKLAAAAGERPSEQASELQTTDRRSTGRRASRTLAQFESLATDLVVAHDSGDPATLERLSAYFRRTATQHELRAAVSARLRALSETERTAAGIGEGKFALPHARMLLARDAGFDSWAEFAKSLGSEAAKE
jgi:ankyrin repeat protein